MDIRVPLYEDEETPEFKQWEEESKSPLPPTHPATHPPLDEKDIRTRRGAKVDIRVPLSQDEETPQAMGRREESKSFLSRSSTHPPTLFFTFLHPPAYASTSFFFLFFHPPTHPPTHPLRRKEPQKRRESPSSSLHRHGRNGLWHGLLLPAGKPPTHPPTHPPIPNPQ